MNELLSAIWASANEDIRRGGEALDRYLASDSYGGPRTTESLGGDHVELRYGAAEDALSDDFASAGTTGEEVEH